MAGPVHATGIGGPAMEAAGVELLCPQDRLAVMGLVEVISHLGFFLKLLRRLEDHLRARRPELVILIDFPDFNFRLARIARKLRIPVLYYICPQVWAWRSGRRHTLAELSDRIAVVFPFEVDLFSDCAVRIEFVGHPLAGEIEPGPGREEFFAAHGLDPGRPLVGLMPGSRVQEVLRHSVPFGAAAGRMRARRGELQFAAGMLPHTAAALPGRARELFDRLDVRRVLDDSLSLVGHSDVLITKSGTTTMEAALLGTPMVIGYRTSRLSYLIARRLVRVRNIGMPNLLVENPAVPELVQDDLQPEAIAEMALELLDESSPLRRRVLDQYARVRRLLTTEKGASRRVAEIVLEMTGREVPDG